MATQKSQSGIKAPPRQKFALSTESAPFRYFIAACAAAIVTLVLFLLMMLLIHIGYVERPETRLKIAKAPIDQAIKLDPEKSSLDALQEETQKLKEPVRLPPAMDTKTSFLSKEPPRLLAAEISFSPHFNKIDLPPLDIELPTAPQNTGTVKSYSTSSGGPGGGSSAGDGSDGSLKCTIVFTVGTTSDDIADLKWIECVNGSIANDAETALYQWVANGADGYHALKPQQGDQIEFTYRQ
jgi:hypothetical protein